MVLKVICESKSGFSVSPDTLIGTTGQLSKYVGVQHSLCVGFRWLYAILSWMVLWVVYNLSHRYKHLSAQKADSLKMFFSFRLL